MDEIPPDLAAEVDDLAKGQPTAPRVTDPSEANLRDTLTTMITP